MKSLTKFETFRAKSRSIPQLHYQNHQQQVPRPLLRRYQPASPGAAIPTTAGWLLSVARSPLNNFIQIESITGREWNETFSPPFRIAYKQDKVPHTNVSDLCNRFTLGMKILNIKNATRNVLEMSVRVGEKQFELDFMHMFKRKAAFII